MTLDSFEDGGEKTIAGMNPRNRSQVRTTSERGCFGPDEFAGEFHALQFRTTIDQPERVIFGSYPLNHAFIFFSFQRAGGINEATTTDNLRES